MQGLCFYIETEEGHFFWKHKQDVDFWVFKIISAYTIAGEDSSLTGNKANSHA